MTVSGRIILAWIVLFVLIQYFIFYQIDFLTDLNSEEIQVQKSTKEKQPKKPIIITWFRLYHKILTHHTSLFNWEKCDHSNCKLVFRTHRRSDGILRIKSDAVLFQGNHLYPAIVQRYNPGQVFVFVSYEPPSYIHSDVYKSLEWDGVFNWTMTYRLDSDIPYRYGQFVQRADEKRKGKNYTKIFKEKHKMAAWIVSHCNSSSKREAYVEKLKKYIDVDTFGDCFGGKECSRTNQCECFDHIEKTYKFYLAFENSFCHDYITEKAYNWTTRNIIVVVRGPPEYHLHLPDGSYIATDDFRTVKDLAYFLLDIGNDEKRYIKYLRTSEDYVLRSMYDQPQIAYCKLCEKLNNLEANRKSYKSISDWWDGKGVCWNKTDDTQ